MELTIKAGSSATIAVTPKINDAIDLQSLAQLNIHIFMIDAFCKDVKSHWQYPGNTNDGNIFINLTPEDTLALLGDCTFKLFTLQFAIEDNESNTVIAEQYDSDLIIKIIKWEAGEWLQQIQQN